MKLGFTGTRVGMTAKQISALAELLYDMPDEPHEFHHGDCVGADVEAADLAKLHGCRIVCHPPVTGTWRGRYPHNDAFWPRKSYFARNRDIVNETDLLIATPKEPLNRGGGTWYTIDYAGQQGKRVIIIRPSGEVVDTPAREVQSA